MRSLARLRAALGRAPDNLRGMLWMLLASLLFVVMTGMVRHAALDMDPMQIAFLRYAFGVVFLLPLFAGRRLHRLRTRRFGLHLVRSMLHTVGVLLWFFALSRIPIAQVTALGFTQPVFATIGAILFMGEAAYLRRIGAVVLGFAGALIVLHPGQGGIDAGSLAMLAAAPLFAASKLMSKVLSQGDSTPTVVFYQTFFVALFAAGPALLVWRTPGVAELGWLFVAALFATLGHLCLVRAVQIGEISAVQPMEFMQLLWASMLGIAVFGEIPTLWTWLGGAVIFLSASYIARREAGARPAPRLQPGAGGLTTPTR
ncbi:MAG TPA: DMT family transporter [Alphaproteobacteria bacterium]|jgi:drug/metabolite transporter (DMT)-like permease|nr:DMT family transporter [Alphaproteobacteria bacterium]